jgi:hypothetical protein
MDSRTLKYLYWISFGLAVFVLLISVGIGLVAFALFVIPIIVFHIKLGLRIERVRNHHWLVIFSALNFLAFTLVRADGAHTISHTGLSALLDIVNINGGFNPRYENYYFAASLVLLVVQVIVDLKLLKSGKSHRATTAHH